MKTFGLFVAMWLFCILISFTVWKEASVEVMLKMILATQLAFIYYKLLKEENKI